LVINFPRSSDKKPERTPFNVQGNIHILILKRNSGQTEEFYPSVLLHSSSEPKSRRTERGEALSIPHFSHAGMSLKSQSSHFNYAAIIEVHELSASLVTSVMVYYAK
jgi:hypothetical protein